MFGNDSLGTLRGAACCEFDDISTEIAFAFAAAAAIDGPLTCVVTMGFYKWRNSTRFNDFDRIKHTHR